MDGDLLYRCHVCGMDPPADPNRILSNGRRIPSALSWRVRCSAEDFKNIVFGNKEVWATFVRAIMVTLDDSNSPVYQLSGIAQNRYGAKIRVPKDRDLAVLGYPRLVGRSCKFVPITVSLSTNQYPRAHLVHARCWELVERLFGRKEAEENLKTLLDIFQRRWPGHNNQDSCYDFLQEDDLLWDKQDSIISGDPVRILPLRAVIEESIQRPLSRETALQQRPIFLDIKRTAVSGIFPYEIQCMILDLLSYKEIPNILRAFGWVLSSSYWSGRLPKDLVFEVDDLAKSHDEIDWQFLTLGVERLLERSPGLLNRRRLLPVLRKVGALFFEEVAKQRQ